MQIELQFTVIKLPLFLRLNKHMKYTIYILSLVFIFGCASISVEYLNEIGAHRDKAKEEIMSSSLRTKIDLDKVVYFPPDEAYCMICDFEENEDKKAFEMATYSGINKAFYTFGEVVCPLKNEVIRLQVYKSIRQNRIPGLRELLFLPFMDTTNSGSTYGGGRYIDLNESNIVNGKITVDLNKAYNPWCAYGDGFNCPIPPIYNHLKVDIKAGEKNYVQ